MTAEEIATAEIVDLTPPFRLTAETVESARRSVCTIVVDDGIGTGFVVAPGRIATCAHVVGTRPTVAVQYQGGDLIAANVVMLDPERDVAILSSDTGDRAPLETYTGPLRETDPCWSIGNPFGTPQLSLVAVHGSYVRLAENAMQPKDVCHWINMAVVPGQSGSPLFEEGGAVIGMISWQLTETVFAGAIPATVLVEALGTQTVSSSPTSAFMHCCARWAAAQPRSVTSPPAPTEVAPQTVATREVKMTPEEMAAFKAALIDALKAELIPAIVAALTPAPAMEMEAAGAMVPTPPDAVAPMVCPAGYGAQALRLVGAPAEVADALGGAVEAEATTAGDFGPAKLHSFAEAKWKAISAAVKGAAPVVPTVAVAEAKPAPVAVAHKTPVIPAADVAAPALTPKQEREMRIARGAARRNQGV